MKTALTSALCCLLLVGVASADVIHLTTGRSIKGTVVKETAKNVVVKTPQGKLTLPLHLVKRIERQSKGATWLALARERARQGALEVAAKLYEKAAKDTDSKIAGPAKAELAALRKQMGVPATPVTPRAEERPKPLPRTPGTASPPAANPKATSLPRLGGGPFVKDTVLAREVVLALRDRDGRKAHSLLDSAKDKFAQDVSFLYLRARAFQVDGESRRASKIYLGLLKGVTQANGRMSVSQLNELARRLLAGEAMSPKSPGASGAWKREESKNFAIYHRFKTVQPWFVNGPQTAFEYDLDVLGLERTAVMLSGRIQVFMFEDKDAYEENSGMELAGGHAQFRYGPDGYLRTITAYAQRGMTLRLFRHEVAHAILLEVHRGMPSWAHEGAAVYVQKQQSRGRYRLSYLGSKQDGTLPGLESLLRDAVARGADQEAVTRYYAQSSVTFEALAKLRQSPRKALQLCERIGQVGPSKALQEVGSSLKTLDGLCDAMAKDRNHDR